MDTVPQQFGMQEYVQKVLMIPICSVADPYDFFRIRIRPFNFFWIRIRFLIRILVFKNSSNSTRPRKISISVPVKWDTSVPGSQSIKATIIISSTQEGNKKKDHEKKDNKKAGSRSGSGIAHTDPDPAKSYGSGRIRIRNTAYLWIVTVHNTQCLFYVPQKKSVVFRAYR